MFNDGDCGEQLCKSDEEERVEKAFVWSQVIMMMGRMVMMVMVMMVVSHAINKYRASR